MRKRTKKRCRKGRHLPPPTCRMKTRSRTNIPTRYGPTTPEGAVNDIMDSNTRDGMGQWDASAAHYPCGALAYCFGGAPTEIGDDNT